MALGAPAALARTANLIQNSSFAITGGSTSFQFGTYGGWSGTYNGESLANWASTSYGFVFNSSSQTVPNAANNGGQALSLYNISTMFTSEAAAGFSGNFVAVDADPPYAKAITQTVTGLVVGKIYTLTFDWAGAQQTGYTGATTEEWQVTMSKTSGKSATTIDTALVNNLSQSWTGWMTATMTFTAVSSTELLSFLAYSTTTSCNLPPFALLANVSLVPEPASVASMFVGIVGLVGLSWRRRVVIRRQRQTA